MAKITLKRRAAKRSERAYYRSSSDGRIIAVTPTKEEALAHVRFLAAASLSVVPKKGSKLTQAQADRIVLKFLNDQPHSAEA